MFRLPPTWRVSDNEWQRNANVFHFSQHMDNSSEITDAILFHFRDLQCNCPLYYSEINHKKGIFLEFFLIFRIVDIIVLVSRSFNVIGEFENI